MLYTLSFIKADGMMHIVQDSVPFNTLTELTSLMNGAWPGKDEKPYTEKLLFDLLDNTAGALALKMGPQLVALITIHAG